MSALLEHSPHLQSPDDALWKAAQRHRRVSPGQDVADSEDNVALRASLKRCMLLLLSKGAVLPRVGVADAEQEIVRAVIQDAVALSLVPSHANEAVVDRALSASRKRKVPDS